MRTRTTIIIIETDYDKVDAPGQRPLPAWAELLNLLDELMPWALPSGQGDKWEGRSVDLDDLLHKWTKPEMVAFLHHNDVGRVISRLAHERPERAQYKRTASEGRKVMIVKPV